MEDFVNGELDDNYEFAYGGPIRPSAFMKPEVVNLLLGHFYVIDRNTITAWFYNPSGNEIMYEPNYSVHRPVYYDLSRIKRSEEQILTLCCKERGDEYEKA